MAKLLLREFDTQDADGCWFRACLRRVTRETGPYQSSHIQHSTLVSPVRVSVSLKQGWHQLPPPPPATETITSRATGTALTHQ